MRVTFLAIFVALAAGAGHAEDRSPAVEGMAEYLMFSDYGAGILLPEQIDETVEAEATFIDVRDAEQFAAGHIPGAMNIEYREVLDRMDEIPASGMVILYCNTGTISSQAMFALRVAGRENVVVLQRGLTGWLREKG